MCGFEPNWKVIKALFLSLLLKHHEGTKLAHSMLLKSLV